VKRLFDLVGLMALLAGCSLPSADKTVVLSGAFPNTTIECQGEVVLADGPCRDWGERLLAGSPVTRSTVRLVLTVRGGNSRCDAEFFAVDARLLAHETTVCPRTS
jgi:hypothetical protein